VIVEAIATRSQAGEARSTVPIFAAIEDHWQSLKPMWRELVREPCGLVKGPLAGDTGSAVPLIRRAAVRMAEWRMRC
jgi:hypothetical protein